MITKHLFLSDLSINLIIYLLLLSVQAKYCELLHKIKCYIN